VASRAIRQELFLGLRAESWLDVTTIAWHRFLSINPSAFLAPSFPFNHTYTKWVGSAPHPLLQRPLQVSVALSSSKPLADTYNLRHRTAYQPRLRGKTAWSSSRESKGIHAHLPCSRIITNRTLSPVVSAKTKKPSEMTVCYSPKPVTHKRTARVW
jgi:hypothetical protein